MSADSVLTVEDGRNVNFRCSGLSLSKVVYTLPTNRLFKSSISLTLKIGEQKVCCGIIIS